MNYQKRIKNHDDPLSVAIDADRENAELQEALVSAQEENSLPKANNARLRDAAREVTDWGDSLINFYDNTSCNEMKSDVDKLRSMLSEVKPQSIAAIQHDAVMKALQQVDPNNESEDRVCSIVEDYAKSLIEGE